jgi:hypothetical protein
MEQPGIVCLIWESLSGEDHALQLELACTQSCDRSGLCNGNPGFCSSEQEWHKTKKLSAFAPLRRPEAAPLNPPHRLAIAIAASALP